MQNAWLTAGMAVLLAAMVPLAAKAQENAPVAPSQEEPSALSRIEAQAYADLNARSQESAAQASSAAPATDAGAPMAAEAPTQPSQAVPETQMAAANVAVTQGPVYTQAPAEDTPPSTLTAPAQTEPTSGLQQDEESGPAAESVSMQTGGRCQSVHPGDVLHFTLRVEDVRTARVVFSNLHMEQGNPRWFYNPAALPLSDGNVLDGGGVGARDAADPKLYHFRFVVPDVAPGLYRVQSVWVRASFSQDSSDSGIPIRLSRRARAEVRSYCLAVFGNGFGDHRMRVTSFQRGSVDPSREPVALLQLH